MIVSIPRVESVSLQRVYVNEYDERHRSGGYLWNELRQTQIIHASQSYFEEGEGRGDGENSVTIIKTVDIVSGDRFDGAAADR